MKTIVLKDPARQLVGIWDNREAILLVGSSGPGILSEAFGSALCPDLPSHLLLASSGTSGSRKAVALSRAAFEASAAGVNALLDARSGDTWINALPCFHVGGLAILLRARLAGAKVRHLPCWDPGNFVRSAEACGATLTSFVPTQLHDLVSAGLRCPASLRAVTVGGGAIDDNLHARALDLGWPLLRTYGMTETCSQVATELSPGSAVGGWFPLLDHFEARTDGQGVLELSGPSLLTGWMIFDNDGTARWEDPKREGWFRTSDRVELRGRELRFLGRVDDLIKIRGELLDVASLERELQARVRSGFVRIDAEPDARNGSALAVVAENAAAEAEAREAVDLFPRYAKPRSFRVGPVAVNPLGKKIRPRAGRL